MDFANIPVPDSLVAGEAVRRLNAMRTFSPSEGLFAEGPGGTGWRPLPKNLRERKAKAASPDNSCFKLDTVEADEQTHLTLVNCYWLEGVVLKHMADFVIDDLIPDDPDEGEDAEVKIICLKLESSSPTVVAVDPESLESEQKNASKCLVPLYRFEGSAMKVDFRNAPQAQFFEENLS